MQVFADIYGFSKMVTVRRFGFIVRMP